MTDDTLSLEGDDEDTPDLPSAFEGGGSSDTYAQRTQLDAFKTEDTTGIVRPEPAYFLVTGAKDRGKSANLSGIPPTFGGEVHIISFDEGAATGGITNYHRNTGKLDRINIFEPAKKRLDDDGEVVFPGFSEENPATAVEVIAQTDAYLSQLQDRDVDVLVLDHFQALHERIGVSFARAEENLGPTARIDFRHYGHRTSMCRYIESKARNIPRTAFALTGYGAEKETEMVEYVKSNGKKGHKPIEKMKDPRWFDKYKKPYHFWLNHTTSREGGDTLLMEQDADIDYYVDVVFSKYDDWLPKGKRFDLTGTDYSVFWEDAETLDERIEGEMKAAKEA